MIEAAPMTVREYFSSQRELYSDEDAARIGPELDRLVRVGRARPRDIVDAARPTDAPLHPYFEWDDRRAAESFRQVQASRMSRVIMVRTVEAGEARREPSARMLTINHPQAAPAPAPRPFVPAPRPPGTPVWRDNQDPAIDAKRRENLSSLPEDEVIARAMARLLGFEATYEGQRSRPEFERVFGPVFEAIAQAARRWK